MCFPYDLSTINHRNVICDLEIMINFYINNNDNINDLANIEDNR